MELLSVDTVEEVKAKLSKATSHKVLPTVKLAATEALGYVLAQQMDSPLNIPDFRRSTVDGYAVMAKDTWGADESTPVFLECVDEVEMGAAAGRKLQAGECIYVPTGGMLPEGANACVMVEYCELFTATSVAIYTSVAEGSSVVEIGEDLKVGEVVLQKGTRLEPGDIAALSAIGVTEVLVYKQLSVTIISTGDELVVPGAKKEVGQVYDINTYGLQAMAIKQHFVINEACIICDDEELLRLKVKQAMQTSDLILVSGGSSQGKKDVTKKVLDEVSVPGVFTHGLALKPGKPTILGYNQQTDTILVGLPGHPVAAMLVFELVVLAYYREQLAIKKDFTLSAMLETNLAGAPGKTTCQLVEVIDTEERYIARPIFGKSGLISILSKANGYILIERNQEGIKAGEQVNVHLL